MLVKEQNRREIEARLHGMGNYVKIDYLSSCLKKQLDFDTRKFVLVKLSELYEAGKMFLEAGKMMSAAANINTSFQGKINDFIRAGSLFVKGGDFENADVAFEKALGCCESMKQKADVKNKKTDYYKSQAKFYLDADKRQSALKAYEKLILFDLPEEERKETQEILLGLYERLGKIKDYYNLKRAMGV